MSLVDLKKNDYLLALLEKRGTFVMKAHYQKTLQKAGSKGNADNV
jgi:hypothetical protein